MNEPPGEDGSDDDGGQGDHQPAGRRSADGSDAGPSRRPGDDAARRAARDARGGPPGAGPEERRRPPEDDEAEDLHPLLDAAGSASVYLIVGSVALVFVGLAALVLGFRFYGNAAVTVAIVGATGSMLLATVVGALSGSINPLD